MENLSILNGKRILLGVTGSIAAYKSPLLVRELIKKGAEVNVLLTKSGSQFVTALTLANLSRNKVIVDMFDDESQTSGAWHIELAHNCDAMIIAPCSATTLGKLANSICDSPLVSVATALPPSIPLIISPAMDSTMWMHPATQRSLKQVESDGAIILPPVDGDLSSGFSGPGRFPEINDIVRFLEVQLANWNGKSRYKSGLTYSVNNIKSEPNKPEQTVYNPFQTPLESISDSVEKDKWKVEFELEELKKKI
jgi:phosphopantothenoylcysteine decarboxylase/phosphopantothenate--cysteine ligase